MKKYFYSFAAICLAFASCTKEEQGVEQNQNDSQGLIHIRAFCEDGLTKTTYALNGDTYEFSWVKGDKIAVQAKKVSNGDFDDAFVFTNTSEAGPTASFSAAGSASYDLGDYAFYPCRYPADGEGFYYTGPYGQKTIWGSADRTDLYFLKSGTAVEDQAAADAATSATVRLNNNFTEDASKPMRHIPLIGKKKGTSNDYYFGAATGVLKLTFANLPASATIIRLDAVDYALSGYFVFDTNGEIKESYKKSGESFKYMNITTSGDVSREVYFPIPTGTIPAGKLTISVKDGTNSLYSVTNKKAITLVRGEVTEVPVITVPGLKVKIHGAADDPKATIYFSGDIAYVKYSNTMTTQYAPSVTCSTSGTTINLPKGYNYKWPFQYQAYNSSNEALGDIQVVYYYTITDTGKSEVCKQFTSVTGDIGLNGGANVPAFRNNAPFSATSPTITFAVSDDAAKGNIVVTEFCGVEGKVYGSYVDYETANGTPKQGLPQIQTLGETFCTAGGNTYVLKDSGSSGARFAVKTTIYGTPNVYGKDANLVCYGQYVYLSSAVAGDGPSVEFFFDPVPHTYTAAGEPLTVFGGESTWEASRDANDLVYSTSTHLYTKSFTVPANVDAVTFKVAQDHAWTKSWGDNANSANNYNYTATKEHTGYEATLTINFNENTGAVTHSYSDYSSDYVLYVKQEELAAASSTWWGSGRSVYCTKDFVQIADESGYKRFLIPVDLLDASNDLYFKGGYAGHECEVKIAAFNPETGTDSYYYKTDGFEIVEEEDSYTTENRVWVQSNLPGDTYNQTLYAHMWQDSNNSNTTDWNSCAMTESGAKYDGKLWYYSAIGSGRDRLIISSGLEYQRQSNKVEYEIDPGKSQYFYFTYDGSSYHNGQLFANPWTE